MDLKDLFLNKDIDSFAMPVCKQNSLLDLESILEYQRNNGNFLGLDYCSKKENQNLLLLCTIYGSYSDGPQQIENSPQEALTKENEHIPNYTVEQLAEIENIGIQSQNACMYIKAFVDTIATFVPNIGVSQKNILQTVISDLFENKENSYPNMTELFEVVEGYYIATKTKPDTLYSAIKDLSSGLFNDDISKNIIDKSIYLNLPPALSDTLRQLCVFLLLRYFNFYFSSANDAEPCENIMPLRYVIVIDEAHIYLKNKNARKALEDLLRLLRSKGVIVVMLSQGVEDYKTKDFDFASQVKLPICLNVQNKDPKMIKAFVGTPRSEHKLINEINKLNLNKTDPEGNPIKYGLINFVEPETIEIRQFWKTMKSES